jgi:hypothetical protein
VGVANPTAPQDRLQSRLLLMFALCFSCWRGVAERVFFHMLHRNNGMCVWKHVKLHKKTQESKVITDSTMLKLHVVSKTVL